MLTHMTPNQISQMKAAEEKTGKIIEKSITDGIKKANAANFADAFRVAVLFELGILAAVFLLSFALPRHIRPNEDGMGL